MSTSETIFKTISILILILIVIVSYGLFHLNTPLNPEPGIVELEVTQGDHAGVILEHLKSRGLIRSVTVSSLYLRYRNKTLKAGFYRFETPVSPREVLDIILKGQVDLVRVTIPEGSHQLDISTLMEKADICTAEGFLNACHNTRLLNDLDPDAVSVEGFLFPDTYRFARRISPRKALITLINRFREVLNKQFSDKLQQTGTSVHDWVIMASLIEKEAQLRKEMPIISGVFHNRLKLGMKLQCDPTVRYALLLDGEDVRRLLYKHLRYDHPYNTYVYYGLPPGPICNPGIHSLRAALDPEPTDALYFVSKNDGTHVFSRTLKEHVAWVRKYQR